MRPANVHQWMTNEMERLSSKLERYKPAGSGYNRIQPVRLSKSVTQMLNNPLPVEDQIGRPATTKRSSLKDRSSDATSTARRTKGVLSRTSSEWEEVYPVVHFKRCSVSELNVPVDNCMANDITTTGDFTHYRNCSTRIT